MAAIVGFRIDAKKIFEGLHNVIGQESGRAGRRSTQIESTVDSQQLVRKETIKCWEWRHSNDKPIEHSTEKTKAPC